MQARFGPPCLADHLVLDSARWKQFGLLTKSLYLFGKASDPGDSRPELADQFV
jgi:hypothetical protein